MIADSFISHRFPFVWACLFPVCLSFSSSKSSTASTQSSSTDTTYNTTDKRVGVDGQSNVVAGEGANVEISVTDVSGDLAAAVARQAADTSRAALQANADVSETALRSNNDAIGRAATLSSDALSANVSATARAMDSGDRAVQAVTNTYQDLSADQVRLLSDLVKSNADTTEATRAGNASLATDLVNKSLLAVTDSKTDTNEKIVTTAIEYFAYAAIAAAFAFALTRRKAA